MEYILSTLVTAIVFMIFILLLAAKPKVSKAITLGAMTFGGIFGLLIYGCGYSYVTDNFLLAILKAVYSVCRSFVGVNDYGSISDAPFMQAQWMQTLCTFAQICSLYATASAIITSIGTQALKKLRLWLGRRKDLHLIYGTNANALGFGNQLMANRSGAVVFVDPQAASSADTAVSAMGCVLQNDGSASEKFLRRIGFGSGKRKITLYALNQDSNKNIQYATRLLASLDALNVSPEKTNLVLMAREEAAVSRLQSTPEKYGYGFVTAVNEPQMAARLLTAKYPPCDVISFDADGKASDDFEALLIGFGQVGQAVLKSLVMNGQFEGSHFKLDVFAKDVDSIDGNFASQFSTLFDEYDIHFHDSDAKSRHMYDHLKQRAQKLRYIVISTGDRKDGHEIAEEILSYLDRIGRSIPVYRCTRQGVTAYDPDGTVKTVHSIYSTELLCSNTLDQKAMIFNHRYQSASGKTAMQAWMECDYFSRQSCRAAADFIPAMLRAAGKTGIDGDWALSPAQIENLSKTEHLRWCAFHYCMGFTAMTDAEYAERAEAYRQGKPIRIGKNTLRRTHACLIPWEELDALSAKENTITGKCIDYKAMDTDNVMAIPQLLLSSEE
ncbi:MAG: metallophosphoesterase [Oscillospiraceae bacterium]|nr:metallophosphoesterase [Oscillospiraceae bacterium]